MPSCDHGPGWEFRRREWPRFIRDAFAIVAVANKPGSPKGKSIRDLGSRMTFTVRDGLPKSGPRKGLPATETRSNS